MVSTRLARSVGTLQTKYEAGESGQSHRAGPYRLNAGPGGNLVPPEPVRSSECTEYNEKVYPP